MPISVQQQAAKNGIVKKSDKQQGRRTWQSPFLCQETQMMQIQKTIGNQALMHPLNSKKNASTASSIESTKLVHEVLSSPGRRLDQDTKEVMESRFGTNFNNVRVHVDPKAANSAHTLNAKAYAAGDDIVFGLGRYDVESHSGLYLLAHELAHVIQQRRGGPAPVLNRDASFERNAKSAALEVTTGKEHIKVRGATSFGIAAEQDSLSLERLPPASDEDLWRLVQSLRGFDVNKPLRIQTEDKQNPVIDKSGVGKKLGRGETTYAAIQLIDKDGYQIKVAVAKNAPGKHAEVLAIEYLKASLGNQEIAGGRMIVFVDQYVCTDCKKALREYSEKLELTGIDSVHFLLSSKKTSKTKKIEKWNSPKYSATISTQGVPLGKKERKSKFEHIEILENIIEQEVKEFKKTKKVSPQLFGLVQMLEPQTARYLLFDDQGKPRPKSLVNKLLARQITFQQSLVSGPSPGKIGTGAKVTSGLLLAVLVAEEVVPFVVSARQERLSHNMQFYNVIGWWQQHGVIPKLGAAVDPFLKKAQITANQTDIWNWITKKTWENIPAEYRTIKEEKDLPGEISKATRFDHLWIEEIPEENWDIFEECLNKNIHNYDDYAAHFLNLKDMDAPPIRSHGNSFEDFKWEILLGRFVTSGVNRVKYEWKKSDKLTKIMRDTAKRVISGTEQMIEKKWAGHKPWESREYPIITTMPASSILIPELCYTHHFETLGPNRKAHFRAKAKRRLFSPFDIREIIIKPKDWWDEQPLFLVYEQVTRSPGYVLVSGADYNTYAAIRSAKLRKYDPTEVVKIPKPISHYGEAFASRRKGPLLDFWFPAESDLTEEENKAIEDYQNRIAEFIEYHNDPIYMGEVRYYFIDHNVDAVGYVLKDDLEWEAA